MDLSDTHDYFWQPSLPVSSWMDWKQVACFCLQLKTRDVTALTKPTAIVGERRHSALRKPTPTRWQMLHYGWHGCVLRSIVERNKTGRKGWTLLKVSFKLQVYVVTARFKLKKLVTLFMSLGSIATSFRDVLCHKFEASISHPQLNCKGDFQFDFGKNSVLCHLITRFLIVNFCVSIDMYTYITYACTCTCPMMYVYMYMYICKYSSLINKWRYEAYPPSCENIILKSHQIPSIYIENVLCKLGTYVTA